MTKTQKGNIEPIELGEIFDQENEAVFQDFRCLSCVGNDTAIMFYDEGSNEITFAQDAVAGNFKVKLTLTDENQIDPKSKVYLFDILISEQEQVAELEKETEKYEAPQDIDADSTLVEVEVTEVIRPTFKIESMSNIGEILISFD